MNDVPFEYCAIRYLDLYVKNDKKLFEAFHYGPNIDNVRALLSKYKVSRSFGGIAKDENARFIVTKLTDEIGSSRSGTDSVICLAKALERRFKKNTLSAASKLLWATNPENIIIYDSQTCAALAKETPSLRRKDKDYERFASAWSRGYKRAEKTIAAAIKSLSGLPRKFTAAHSMSDKEFRKAIRSRAFRRRVYDQFLWQNGYPAV